MNWGGHPSEFAADRGRMNDSRASASTAGTTASSTSSKFGGSTNQFQMAQPTFAIEAAQNGSSDANQCGKFIWPFATEGPVDGGDTSMSSSHERALHPPPLEDGSCRDSGGMDWDNDGNADNAGGEMASMSAAPSFTPPENMETALLLGSSPRDDAVSRGIAPDPASLLPLKHKCEEQKSQRVSFVQSGPFGMNTEQFPNHDQPEGRRQHPHPPPFQRQSLQLQQGQQQSNHYPEHHYPAQQELYQMYSSHQSQPLQAQQAQQLSPSSLQPPQHQRRRQSQQQIKATQHQHLAIHHPTPILPRHDVAIMPKPTPCSPTTLIPPTVVKHESIIRVSGMGSGRTAASDAFCAGSAAKRGTSGAQVMGTSERGMQEEDGMSDERKKRLRNEREQRRAHLITDQIDSLKGVLENSNFPLRSTSKFDILAACDEYIQHLRQRKNCLDLKHKLSGGGAGSPMTGFCKYNKAGIGVEGQSSSSVSSASEDNESTSSWGGVRGAAGGAAASQREIVLDFSEIFRSSHVPMAVVSIDGRLLQCNVEFSRVTGYTNDKLAGVTLFGLAAPECLEQLFKSIARLLSTAALDEKNPAYFATAAARATPFSHPGYKEANILLSLVRDEEHRARAFHCCIVAPQRYGQIATESTMEQATAVRPHM
nr:bHLH transcription factor 1 [Microchloropsis salina]